MRASDGQKALVNLWLGSSGGSPQFRKGPCRHGPIGALGRFVEGSTAFACKFAPRLNRLPLISPPGPPAPGGAGAAAARPTEGPLHAGPAPGPCRRGSPAACPPLAQRAPTPRGATVAARPPLPSRLRRGNNAAVSRRFRDDDVIRDSRSGRSESARFRRHAEHAPPRCVQCVPVRGAWWRRRLVAPPPFSLSGSEGPCTVTVSPWPSVRRMTVQGPRSRGPRGWGGTGP
jgi:hypothetical protein